MGAKDLDDLVSAASHDLRAPLRDIANLAAWIDEDVGDALPPTSARHLAMLRDRVARMERLLDDLLAYYRAGSVERPPESFPAEAVIAEAVRDVAPPPGFSLRTEGAGLTLRTLRAPLSQVLRNLIANAIKHHGGPTGRVAVRVFEAREGWAGFEVSDDGPGIAPEHHARIFQLFQTLRPRDEVEGSGMGLAIVKRVVESHGGTVWVRSEPGQGATFAFTWPRESATLAP